MKRLVAVLLLVPATVVALPASAGAADQIKAGRQHMAQARDQLSRALDAVKAGDRDRAYKLARAAYLDNFEFVEVPLRLRNPTLVLDAEFGFAQVRNGIKDGTSKDQIRSDIVKLRSKLLDVDRELASKGLAAPALAFGFSFAILFREGVEAVLLIAILLSSLAAGSAANYRRPLGLGALAAIGATAATWVVFAVILDLAPVNRELLSAITALVAVGILIIVSFWLIQRLEQKRRMEFMRARTAAAIAAGSTAAFAGLGFMAVYREGFETVLFYQALVLFAQGLVLWVILGAVAAAVSLAAVGYAILRAGRTLPLKPMLVGGASVLLLLSVAFTGNAVRSLQEADVLSVNPVSGSWARLPTFAAELTGIHPTVQGLLAQAILLSIFIVGAAWVFGVQPRLRRRRAVAEATTA
jgi:high-affinity iron transporter